jgi:hypothetical protein
MDSKESSVYRQNSGYLTNRFFASDLKPLKYIAHFNAKVHKGTGIFPLLSKPIISSPLNPTITN